MNPSCPTSNNNIFEPYEYIKDIYYDIKSSGVNVFINNNNKKKLLGQTDGYQTRPTHRVSGGVFIASNEKKILIRGSAFKINNNNYILDKYSLEN